LETREERSVSRLYYYAIRLRLIAENMGESFVYPTDKDIEKALSYQKKRGLSEWSIKDK